MLERFTYSVPGRQIAFAQLDEEIRVACGLAQVPGLWKQDDLLTIATPLDVALRPQADAAVASHVANPLFAELGDVRTCRLYLNNANPTDAQTVLAVQA